MTMISELLTSQEMWKKFTELGFGRAPQANFPGVASGRLRPWERWRPIERATMAYGYGLSVSLLQIAHAYTAFARNGDMVSMTLLKREGKPTSVQVYSPHVDRKSTRLNSVTNAQIVCRLLLEQKKHTKNHIHYR